MTIEEFVTRIWEQPMVREALQASMRQPASLAEYGHQRGWLEDPDVTGWHREINRMTAARIIHEILRKELGEPDEESWRGAECLADLYDCHTCVNHVAQVYSKGIMEAEEDGRLFGMRRELTDAQAQVILPRIASVTARKKPPETDSGHPDAIRLSYREALLRLEEERNAILIDVRTLREYEEDHLPGAVSIPMASILNDPKSIAVTPEQALFFYCGQGYQSEIAAECVAQAGYEKVFYFGLKS